jgi:hypothetical protein
VQGARGEVLEQGETVSVSLPTKRFQQTERGEREGRNPIQGTHGGRRRCLDRRRGRKQRWVAHVNEAAEEAVGEVIRN